MLRFAEVLNWIDYDLCEEEGDLTLIYMKDACW